MKAVYHNRYREVYSSDLASASGRLESIYDELHGVFEFAEPKSAHEEDVLLFHGQDHIDSLLLGWQ